MKKRFLSAVCALALIFASAAPFAESGALAKFNINVSAKEDDYPLTQDSEYPVVVTTDGHGTAIADVSSGAEGTEVTLTATPDEYYKFKEWQVISGNVTIENNKFTIGTEPVNIKAIFVLKPTVVSTETVVDKTSTVYAGEISVDGESQVKYLYSPDITISASIFDNLKDTLGDTAFDSMVPNIANETIAVSGFFRYSGNAQDGTIYIADTNYFGGISEDWSDTGTVAERCFKGAVTVDTNDDPDTFSSVLRSSVKSKWTLIEGTLVRLDTITFYMEETTVIYTKAEVSSSADIRKKGDVVKNDKIDNADLLAVKSHIKKIKTLTGDDLWAADVDGNGAVNNTDLIAMKAHIKGVKKLW